MFACECPSTGTLPIWSSGPSYSLEDQQTALRGNSPAPSSAGCFREFPCTEGTEHGEAFPGTDLGKASGNLSLGFPARLPRALETCAFLSHRLSHLLNLPAKLPELKSTGTAPLSEGEMILACHGLSSRSLQRSLQLQFLKAPFISPP